MLTQPLVDYSGAPRREIPFNGANHGLAPSHPRATPGTHPPPAMHSPSESLYADDVDGLATVPSTDDSNDLYGASSTIAFVQFCHHEARRQSTAPLDDETGAARTTSERQHGRYRRPSSSILPEPIRIKDLSASVFPPRQTADDLARCFWEFVHPVFPVLHKTSFMDRYALIWSGAGGEIDRSPIAELDETVFTSTLNLVFALGSKYSESVPPAERAPLAQSFYQRSRAIYRFEMLDSASLPLVQMLLLTGVYLQSDHQANRCWNVIGLAIRVAQSVGLHVESPRHTRQTQKEREMRRRIWHNCLNLDK